MKFSPTDYHSKPIEDYIVNMFFYNREFRTKYFDMVIPNIFYYFVNRYIIYVIRKLHSKNEEVDFRSVSFYALQPTPDVEAFIKRSGYNKPPSIQDIMNVLVRNEYSDINHTIEITDITIAALQSLYKLTFKRFVELHMHHISDCLQEDNFREVLNRAGAINKVYSVLFSGKLDVKEMDKQLAESVEMINNEDEYIPTFSEKLNSIIGGFTRKAVATIIGKSGHNKTTFCLFNALYTIRHGFADKVLFISTEEDASFYWRRLFAMILGIKLSDMRNKNVKILDEHIETVKNVVGTRIRIITDVVKYKDVVDVLSESNDDIIYIDHLQNIIYPGNGTFLANMIGGIPQLISVEKQTTRKFNNVVVNLSQVNDKDIQGDFARHNKAPRYYDAYASSSMYQGSREFLSLWYPIRDFDELSKEDQLTYTAADVIVSVEKSNFTQVGKVRLQYRPDYCYFEDMK